MNTLLSIRKNRGLTQSEVAKELGISRQAYANYETGKREPDNRTLLRIAEFFEVSVDYLLGKTEAPQAPVSDNLNLSPDEQQLILAYRNNPSMQEAVNRLLGIEKEKAVGNITDDVRQEINDFITSRQSINAK